VLKTNPRVARMPPRNDEDGPKGPRAAIGQHVPPEQVKSPSPGPMSAGKAGRSAKAPGQMKKVAGVQSAKTFTRGYPKKPVRKVQ